MSRKTQRYSKEFKAEAVRTVLENQLSISEGASRLSLPEGTLGQWVTAARKGLGTPGSRTVAELESEILQLRKALNEARLERDILKKSSCRFNLSMQHPFQLSLSLPATVSVISLTCWLTVKPYCVMHPAKNASRVKKTVVCS